MVHIKKSLKNKYIQLKYGNNFHDPCLHILNKRSSTTESWNYALELEGKKYPLTTLK